MKRIIFITLIFIVLVLIALIGLKAFAGNKAQAHGIPQCKALNSECEINNSEKTCCSGLVCVPFNEHSDNYKCRTAPTNTPTPTLIPTVTPTSTPEPTATPSATPTPTDTPKQECEEGFELVENECEPLPTPTPTVEPEPEVPFPQPQRETGESGPARCTDGSILALPINFFVIRNGESADLRWVPTGGNQVSVFYKVTGHTNWEFALADQPNNGDLTINALNPNLGYDWGLMQKQGCGGGQMASVVAIDPPAYGRIFPASYWQWE